MDPTGDNKLSLPELGVTVELLEHETWEREVHMSLKKIDDQNKIKLIKPLLFWMEYEDDPSYNKNVTTKEHLLFSLKY